jgi:hypothetical protein
MTNNVPFVQTACVAESVLIEPDGVASAVRIIDTFTVHEPPGMPANMKPATTVTFLITLKSGAVKGESELDLILREPSGKTKPLGSRPIVLEGGIHGANLKFNLNVLGLQYGEPYWLDVLWGAKGKQNKTLLTSVPFRFKRAEPEQSMAATKG